MKERMNKTTNTGARIVFYTREGQGQAGFEIRSHDLSIELLKHGIHSHIVSFKDFHKNKSEQEIGFLTKIFLNIKSFFKILRFKPEILILQRVNYHFIAALIYKMLFGPKLILDIDDWEIRENLKTCFFGLTNSFADNLTKFIASFSDVVVVSSIYLEEYLTPYAKKIIKIPSGISQEQFTKSEDSTVYLRCVWNGSLEREETVDDICKLVKIFAEKADSGLKLLIIARGHMVEKLNTLIKNINNPSIQLIKNCHRKDIPKLLSSCHIGLLPLFHPSRFYQAKSPVKLFEYMATGLIVVASKQGEVSHILKDGESGVLVSSHQEMMDRVNLISRQDFNINIQLVNKAYSLYQAEFSLEEVSKTWQEILVDLM